MYFGEMITSSSSKFVFLKVTMSWLLYVAGQTAFGKSREWFPLKEYFSAVLISKKCSLEHTPVSTKISFNMRHKENH